MKKDDIVLIMVGFFINEMIDNGIATDKEISKYFDEEDEKAFKKMIKEYKKIQSLTRNKAVNRIIQLKNEINNLKSDIKISK